MKLSILGCHSATPRVNTNPTSQVLEIKNHIFLIDCGEGTQVALRKQKIRFSRIKHIFISHLHGDHYFGLFGLIGTFNLSQRETELHIYAPRGLKELITMQMKLAGSWTTYPLIFHELQSKQSEVIFEDTKVAVKTVPLNHRVYTNGFVFSEKLGERKLDIDAVREANINKAYYQKLKQGADVFNEDMVLIDYKTVTADPQPAKSYAFCSDTAYDERIIPHIKNVTALYHESTFLEKHLSLCDYTKHSTAKQAALIAKAANVGQLILGHYSTRYNNYTDFKAEAQKVFDNVILAKDGKMVEFN